MFNYKSIPHYFSFSSVYDQIVDRFPSGSIFVEVGTWMGASAIYMAHKIKESKKDITFYAIDNFTAQSSGPVLENIVKNLGGNFYKEFRNNLIKYDAIDIVHPIIGDSTESAFLFNNQSIDFVYIDACHTFQKVRDDIKAWLPKVKIGGVLAGHDYNEKHLGLKRAVDACLKKKATIIPKASTWLFEKIS